MSKRRAWDRYLTDEWATELLCENLNLNTYTSILEPCAGVGNIAKIIDKYISGRPCYTVDIDSQMPTWRHENMAFEEGWERLNTEIKPLDWTITNPPFELAFKILQLALKYSEQGVAFLLRMSFLEPVIERAVWLRDNPPNKLFVLPRISFTGDGKTDSVTCAWMIWDKRAGYVNHINPIRILIPEIETFGSTE